MKNGDEESTGLRGNVEAITFDAGGFGVAQGKLLTLLVLRDVLKLLIKAPVLHERW